MKKLILAAGMLTLFASAASAQRAPAWEAGKYPYAKRYHSVCIDKARRLNGFEARAKADGKLSRSERATMAALQRDLDKTCGRYRWNG